MNNETNIEINKPTSIVKEEFVKNLYSLISQTKFPPFLVELILKDVLVNIKEMSKIQYEKDNVEYYKMLDAQNNAQ